LLGKTPKDWDVCTSAFPEQTKECFAGQKVIEKAYLKKINTSSKTTLPFKGAI